MFEALPQHVESRSMVGSTMGLRVEAMFEPWASKVGSGL